MAEHLPSNPTTKPTMLESQTGSAQCATRAHSACKLHGRMARNGSRCGQPSLQNRAHPATATIVMLSPAPNLIATFSLQPLAGKPEIDGPRHTSMEVDAAMSSRKMEPPRRR